MALSTREHGAGPAPPPVPLVAALAASHDLPVGAVLHAADLRPVRLPSAAVPAHAFTDRAALVGRQLSGPIRRGEVLTDVRVRGPGLAAGLSSTGMVAVPLRLADPGAATLLRAGDRVDVLVVPDRPDGPEPPTDGEPEARLLASGLAVLAVPDAASDPLGDATLVVVAAPNAVARRIAGASPGNRLTVTLRPP